MTVILGPQTDEYMVTINNLLLMTDFDHYESHHWNKTSVDYLNNLGRGEKKVIADIDRWEFVKGIQGNELSEELGFKNL